MSTTKKKSLSGREVQGTLNYTVTCPGGNHQKGEDDWSGVVRTEVGGIGRGQIT